LFLISGKPLDSSMKKSIERLRTWDSRSQAHSSAERNLRQALSEMDKMKPNFLFQIQLLKRQHISIEKQLKGNLSKVDLFMVW